MAHLYEGYSKDKLLKAFSHNQVKFEHSLVKGDTYSCESCGNEHTVIDPACVVRFKSRLSHCDCLLEQLANIVLAVEALTQYPDCMHDINGFCSGNGIWWCSRDDCDYYKKDGRDSGTCELMGSQPKSVCVPWLAKLIRGVKDSVEIGSF